VKFDRGLHIVRRLLRRASSGDITGKIGRVGRVACFSFFENDQVFHHFRPACLRILSKVPGAKSSLSLPGTVTSPGFAGFLYCQ